MKLGLKIKELRESKGWTQEDLGNKIEVKRQQIQAYESGKNFPPYEKQVKLCIVFDVDMNTLAWYDLIENNMQHTNEKGEGSILRVPHHGTGTANESTADYSLSPYEKAKEESITKLRDELIEVLEKYSLTLEKANKDKDKIIELQQKIEALKDKYERKNQG